MLATRRLGWRTMMEALDIGAPDEEGRMNLSPHRSGALTGVLGQGARGSLDTALRGWLSVLPRRVDLRDHLKDLSQIHKVDQDQVGCAVDRSTGLNSRSEDLAVVGL